MIHTESVVCAVPACDWKANVTVEADDLLYPPFGWPHGALMPWRAGVLWEACVAARLAHVVAEHVEQAS